MSARGSLYYMWLVEVFLYKTRLAVMFLHVAVRYLVGPTKVISTIRSPFHDYLSSSVFW
jgi:hypothetical protein